MKFKRNLFFPAVLLLVIVGMTAIAAPVVMQKYGDSQSWSQKNIPGSTPVLRQQGSSILPNTGLQGQVAQAASSDCTYTFVYWKDHPEQLPDSLTVGQLTYTKQQASNLFQSNVGVDPVAATQNPIQYLEIQAYIATLNIKKQGSSPYEIQQTLTEASNWLAQNENGATSSVFDGSVGFNLAQNLEDYNNGFTGPGLCPNQPPFPKLTATPANSPSPVPTQTPTPQKSKFVIQQNQQDQKQNDQNPPAAPTTTPQPPTATPAPPTANPLPPTATQAPPTNTPRPTNEPPVPPRDPQPPPDKPKPPGKPPKPPGKPPKPKPTKIPKGSGTSQVFPSFFG